MRASWSSLPPRAYRSASIRFGQGATLARGAGRQLVGFVAGDHQLAAEEQFAQPGAELGHGGMVGAGADLVLLPG